jgi:hypothetical protein
MVMNQLDLFAPAAAPVPPVPPEIAAVWQPGCGYWQLYRDGEIVTDSDGEVVHLDKAVDCTRYAKNHFGVGIGKWVKP